MTNLFRTNRLVFFAPGTPDKPVAPEVASEIPKAEEITREHIDDVLNAADKNIKIINDYYEDPITKMSSAEMPEDIKKSLEELTALRDKLKQFRYNPTASRDLLVKMYGIFGKLDAHADKTVEEARDRSGDPLKGLGIIAGIYRPLLSTEKPEEKKAETPDKAAETKEQTKEQLVLAAVENIAKAGGELTQEMLDAVKTYKPGKSPLRFDFEIDGNPVTLFVERAEKGFAVMGATRNEKTLTPSQAPTWKTAVFTDTYSYTAGESSPPGITMKPQEQYLAMIKNEKLPAEKLA